MHVIYTFANRNQTHTLMWCDVEPPAGVQPQQHHTNKTSSLSFTEINYWRLFFSHRRREISVYRLTQIMFSHCLKERSSAYLGIREGVLEIRWQPWQKCEEGASGTQVCNNNGAEIQTRAFRMHLKSMSPAQPVRQKTLQVHSVTLSSFISLSLTFLIIINIFVYYKLQYIYVDEDSSHISRLIKVVLF